MEKRYQVFVSSTYDDLQKERQEVMQALLELDCIPSGMELFPAADDDQWTLIKKIIDECDYYIVILTGRYGSLGPDGISFTEMEYRYALNANKPIIAFLHRHLGSITSEKFEQVPKNLEKLQQFRELTEKKMCKHWSTPDELGSVVSRSMIKLMKSTPAIGWIRANNVSDLEELSKANLTLRKYIKELKSELGLLGGQAPVGTENLAQGDHEYVLKFRIVIHGPFDYGVKSPISEDYQIKTTWNNIAKSILPHCIIESTEDDIFRSIETDFQIIPESINEKIINENWNIFQHKLEIISFQEIIVQLKALGLILPSIEKQRGLNNDKKYWTLSKYGEKLMGKLCAIHKPD